MIEDYTKKKTSINHTFKKIIPISDFHELIPLGVIKYSLFSSNLIVNDDYSYLYFSHLMT